MARKRVVSRTVKTTVATVKAVDAENEQILTMSFNLPYLYKSDEAVLKKCKTMVTNPNVQIIKVMDTNVVTVHAEMPEEDFLKVAKITPIN